MTEPATAGNRRRREPEAELASLRAYRESGDLQARNQLVEHFSWIGRHCARRFADRGEPFDDLLQVGLLGVLKAVDRYDPEIGTSFVSFAIPTVLGELRRHFRDTTWAVRVPRRLKERHVEVGATVEFLNGENGRPPTPELVAAHLGISVEEVLEALDAGAAYRSSPLNVSGERGDEGERVGYLFGRDDADLTSAADRLDLREALTTLPPRERRILELRFTQGLSQSEIADVVGVSQVHVSRLLRSSIRLLQSRLGDVDGEPPGSTPAAGG